VSAPETNKRESNSSNSFLGTDKPSKEPVLIYTQEQEESTALDTVFDKLFKLLTEKK
jgi:hypothetical protein